MHLPVRSAVILGVAFFTPWLIWGLIAIAARKKPWLLTLIFPYLRAVSWITYLLGVAAGLIALSTLSRQAWLQLSVLGIFNGGIQLVRGWVQRRVDPDPFSARSSDGWWPAKKDF